MKFEVQPKARTAFYGANPYVYTANGRFGRHYSIDQSVKGWRLISYNFNSFYEGFYFLKLSHAKQAARDMESGHFKESSAICKMLN